MVINEGVSHVFNPRIPKLASRCIHDTDPLIGAYQSFRAIIFDSMFLLLCYCTSLLSCRIELILPDKLPLETPSR